MKQLLYMQRIKMKTKKNILVLFLLGLCVATISAQGGDIEPEPDPVLRVDGFRIDGKGTIVGYESWDTIGDFAFGNNKLTKTSVVIPNSVIFLSERAFDTPMQ